VVDVPLARRAPSAPEVRAALEAVRPDVVHVNLVDPASNAAAVRAALDVAPATATLHLHGDCGATPEERRSLAVLHARLERILTPARVTKDELVRALGLPGRHVVVVPNGVDVPAVPLAPDPRPGPLVVGALGRLTDQKGFDVLLEAVAGATAAGHEFRVVVGGEGRDRDRLLAQARGLPVDFAGFVHDVPAFLRSVDLFCLPSRREAMPLALLEAMGHGLPCIATDVGAVRASVGDAAVVIPPDDVAALADALCALLADGERRATLATRARARAVAAFDADLMARRTFAVLGRTLRDRSTARALALPAPQGAAV
jgi:glycosyltransferase involved in cell wall biosynthesis